MDYSVLAKALLSTQAVKDISSEAKADTNDVSNVLTSALPLLLNATTNNKTTTSSKVKSGTDASDLMTALLPSLLNMATSNGKSSQSKKDDDDGIADDLLAGALNLFAGTQTSKKTNSSADLLSGALSLLSGAADDDDDDDDVKTAKNSDFLQNTLKALSTVSALSDKDTEKVAKESGVETKKVNSILAVAVPYITNLLKNIDLKTVLGAAAAAGTIATVAKKAKKDDDDDKNTKVKTATASAEKKVKKAEEKDDDGISMEDIAKAATIIGKLLK